MKYEEIARTRIAENRSVVISKVEEQENTFTIAQVLEVQEMESNNTKPIQVYMKGAIHIPNVEALYFLRDMLNLAINIVENPETNDEAEDWD